MIFDSVLREINKTYRIFRLQKQLKKCHNLIISFAVSVKIQNNIEQILYKKSELAHGLQKLVTTAQEFINSLEAVQVRNDHCIKRIIRTVPAKLLDNLKSYDNRNSHEVVKVSNSLAVDFYLLYKADMENPWSEINEKLWRFLDQDLEKFKNSL